MTTTDRIVPSDRLLLLHRISTVMQETLELHHLFSVVLSACTAGEGLGFNRAFLFLVDRRKNKLGGRLAVGPESAEDCAHIWNSRRESPMTPEEFVASLSRIGGTEYTDLTARLQEIRVPLEEGHGVIVKAALTQQPQLVLDAHSDSRVNAEIRATLDLQHFAVIPLVAKGETEGVILVDNKYNQRPITDEDLLLLSVLASQAAVAIRNARLYEQIERLNEQLEARVEEATADLQRRLQQLSLLHDFDLAILSQRDPGDILQAVMERAVELCDASCGAILLVGEAERSLKIEASRVRDDTDLCHEMLQVGEWVAHEVAIKGEPKSVDQNDVLGQALFCSILAVPMVFQRQTIGVIHLERPSPTRFSEFDLEVLTMLARVATLVLHNARMYNDVERRYREVASLSEVQQAIVSSVDLDELLPMIVRRAVEAVPGTLACVIRLVEGGNDLLVQAASYVRPGTGLTPEDLDQIEETMARPGGPSTLHTSLISGYTVVCVPLRVQDDVIGVMHVYWRPPTYDAREHPTMLGFASQAATAIHNVRLYHSLAQSYKELRETQAALRQKEKLAILGEMAATVAHEIRNPLTAIRGYSQRIESVAGKDLKENSLERVVRYARTVVDEVDRLNRVVGDVLNFSRRTAVAMSQADVNQIVLDVLRLEEGTAQSANVVVTTELGAELPRVTCDGNQIRQVLVNLVQNGIQAMPDGGALRVETVCADNQVQISVTDTGVGIPPESIEEIFQPFHTTKPTGTGLGLSLVKRVIEEDHRGGLSVTSTPGQGSTFTVSLPLHPGDRPSKETTP